MIFEVINNIFFCKRYYEKLLIYTNNSGMNQYLYKTEKRKIFISNKRNENWFDIKRYKSSDLIYNFTGLKIFFKIKTTLYYQV